MLESEDGSILAFLCEAINSLQEEFELPINKVSYALSFSWQISEIFPQ